MPVSSQHPDYEARKPSWIKCRDAYDGSESIKAAGVAYLPRLSEQSTEDYAAYKHRALFYSITSKTLAALVGMASAKPPICKYPEELKPYFADDSGVQFHEILSQALTEDLLMGRFGVFIDRPETGGPPTLAGYAAESIINWRTDAQGDPTMVVLEESILVQDPQDAFKLVKSCQYRHLLLVANPDLAKTLMYVQDLYDADDKFVRRIVPTNTGKVMDYIPFYVVNPYGLGFAMQKPPVIDIVDINISHYCTSADLEHGRHYTGLPVPVVSGVDASTTLRIGSMTAWVLPDPNARATYLEFTGQGLISLEKALSEKQSQLASLSARLIGQSSNGSEAAETVRLRYMSETASLAAVVRAIEALMNRIYKCLAKMEDLNPDEVSIKMDKEFLDSRMSANDLRETVKAFIEGGISAETLVYNLRRGDVLPPDREDSAELAAIVAAQKVASSATQGGPVNNPTGV